ncbi:hypothetical protein PVIIG_05549 [Plasmodium vivax India VII]|uniref:VIR protein n=1 Tax=Plasmodium vivax India VII TaxID=1077284 RepID=A0A0J9SI86_PLAVI|nr:hypothetical protein PVIIG_05549 [Plasmodium vivax India VII]
MSAPSCFHSDNTYLDYKCYTRLKKFFDINGKSKEKSDIFDKIIEQAHIPSDTKLSNDKILQNLEQHLKGYGVFFNEDHDECCKYINFWLNKEVKEKHYSLYNDSKFKIFKDFVTHFNYIVHSQSSKRCLSNINNIDPKIFEKMSKLYELYDLYLYLKESYSTTLRNNKCKIFGQIIGDHNRSLAEYQDSDEPLTEILIRLKGLIENLDLQFNDQCPYKKSELHISKLEAQRKEAEIKKRQEELEKEQQELRMKEEETRRQQEITRRKLEEATREAEQRRSTLLPSGNDVLGIIDAQESPGTNEIQKLEDYMHPKFGQYMETSQGIKDFANHLSVQPQEENELPISSPDSPERKWNSITDTQGTMGKITGVITGVLGEVEPAPILGVSGGMCALFLLFKEEEDVTFEYPVVSLERTQVFQNIMMVILESCLLIYLIKLNRIYYTIISDQGNLFYICP